MTYKEWKFAGGSLGDVEFEWNDELTRRPLEDAPTAALKVTEPWRESYGHTVCVTGPVARELSGQLLAFAEAVEASTRESSGPAPSPVAGGPHGTQFD